MIEFHLRPAGDHAILEILSLGLSFVIAPQVGKTYLPAPLVTEMILVEMSAALGGGKKLWRNLN